jgi:putative phage-type endonuclease
MSEPSHTVSVPKRKENMQIYAPELLNGAKLLGNFEPGSPEWHAERSNGVGGSEVGTILGLNPYESAYALWAKKTGKIDGQIKGNWAIRFGKAFEEPILKLWMEEHPDWYVYTTGTYSDPDCSYRHANPDAIAIHKFSEEMMVIEVKTARNTWESVPPAYLAQVLHYMGVLKITRGVIVAVAGMTWNEYEVPYNQEAIDLQNEMIDAFWHSVTEDHKPAWDGSEATYNAVRAETPEIAPVEAELGALGVQLLEAQEKADKANSELLRAKSAVMHQMGNAKYGVIPTLNGPERIVSRQMRAGTPSLVINKKGTSWV